VEVNALYVSVNALGAIFAFSYDSNQTDSLLGIGAVVRRGRFAQAPVLRLDLQFLTALYSLRHLAGCFFASATSSREHGIVYLG
jgi:hypothetical protein